MKKVKTLIVEDNLLNAQRLRQLILKYCTELEVMESATGVHSAISAIERIHPDLVFLDVELPDGNGFDVLEKYSPIPFKVIFFTSHLIYAYQAIKFHAIDFLLKPVRISDLIEAVKIATSSNLDEEYARKIEAASKQFADPAKIILHEATGFTIFEMAEIIMLEAEANYTHLFLTGRRKLSYCRILKEYEELLEIHAQFMRVHRSYLINLDHVVSYNSQGVIKLSEGLSASLGNSYRETFLHYFQ
jgi:two-component system LytT family response regulator